MKMFFARVTFISLSAAVFMLAGCSPAEDGAESKDVSPVGNRPVR